jgi:ATP phosphoribosyltransferase regulatory subunit HisZ
MAELDASKLPGDASKELREFLEKKLSVKIKEAGGKLTVEKVSNTRLRKAARWFLSRKGLSDEYRVLSSEKSLVIKKRKKD